MHGRTEPSFVVFVLRRRMVVGVTTTTPTTAAHIALRPVDQATQRDTAKRTRSLADAEEPLLHGVEVDRDSHIVVTRCKRGSTSLVSESRVMLA